VKVVPPLEVLPVAEAPVLEALLTLSG